MPKVAKSSSERRGGLAQFRELDGDECEQLVHDVLGRVRAIAIYADLLESHLEATNVDAQHLIDGIKETISESCDLLEKLRV